MATPTNLPASFSSGQVLTATNQNDLRGAFRVLQVIQTVSTAAYSNGSTTWNELSGLNTTITPQSSTNKILITVTGKINKSNGNAGNNVNLRLKRGATVISTNLYLLDTGTTLGLYAPFSMTFLDSPGTINSTQYVMDMKNDVNFNIVGWNTQSEQATMTLMEISA